MSRWPKKKCEDCNNEIIGDFYRGVGRLRFCKQCSQKRAIENRKRAQQNYRDRRANQCLTH